MRPGGPSRRHRRRSAPLHPGRARLSPGGAFAELRSLHGARWRHLAAPWFHPRLAPRSARAGRCFGEREPAPRRAAGRGLARRGLMRTVDTLWVAASPDRVYGHAADVERWPTILPHYRWVRLRERRPEGGGLVEMAAWRPFGPLRWPTWWLSEMRLSPARREVRYQHIGGVTTGMAVLWSVIPEGSGSRATIIHEWDGPPWPLLKRPAADWVIGPVFVHGIASRTLAGIAKASEAADE